ncbi:MAG: hypothetical protein AAFV29_02950, partial [Myxococcota bacterium]
IEFSDPKDSWTGNDGFLGHYIRFGAMPTHGVRFRICDPVDPNDYESAQDMAEQMRTFIANLAT